MKNLLIIIISFFILTTGSAMAYVMGSSNYRIQQDSINVGGTDSGSSASYNLQDTLGEVATGRSSSGSYNLHAGYRQMDEVYISITSPVNVLLSPAISGISGGMSSGSAVWNVMTDSSSGYSLSIKASTEPALQSDSSSFNNYGPGGSDPDFDWSIEPTSAEFGFTPEGNDIRQKYKDDGVSCNTGANDTTGSCWYHIQTSDEIISRSTSSNHLVGATTTVKFRAEVGSNKLQTAGTYSATITLTAVTL